MCIAAMSRKHGHGRVAESNVGSVACCCTILPRRMQESLQEMSVQMCLWVTLAPGGQSL